MVEKIRQQTLELAKAIARDASLIGDGEPHMTSTEVLRDTNQRQLPVLVLRDCARRIEELAAGWDDPDDRAVIPRQQLQKAVGLPAWEDCPVGTVAIGDMSSCSMDPPLSWRKQPNGRWRRSDGPLVDAPGVSATFVIFPRDEP